MRFEIQINGSYGIIVNLVHLWHAADSRSWVAGNPIQEEGGEPLLKKDGGAGEEVANSFSILLPSVLVFFVLMVKYKNPGNSVKSKKISYF